MDKLYTIDELAKKTKVSTRTIRFYNQEKLISPPVQFKSRTALYNKEHIERINLIKTLKNKYFLPLAVIKENLADPKKMMEMQNRLKMDNDIMYYLKYKTPTISQEELSKISELSLATIKQLEKVGFISAVPSENKKVYPVDSLQIAICIKKFMDEGFTLKEMSFFPEIIGKFVNTGFATMNKRFDKKFKAHPEKIAPMMERIGPVIEELLILTYRKLLHEDSRKLQINIFKEEIIDS